MENVFIDHNLQKMPLRVIMVGAIPVLTKNPGYASAKETFKQ